MKTRQKTKQKHKKEKRFYRDNLFLFESKNHIISINLNWSNNYCLYSPEIKI